MNTLTFPDAAFSDFISYDDETMILTFSPTSSYELGAYDIELSCYDNINDPSTVSFTISVVDDMPPTANINIEDIYIFANETSISIDSYEAFTDPEGYEVTMMFR